MRRVTSVVLVAGLLAGLAGCTSTPAPPRGCVPAKAGAVSRSVHVTGEYGRSPTVKFGGSLAVVPTTQRSVITRGTGALARPGNRVRVEMAVYSGTSGKQLTTTGYDGSPLTFTLNPSRFLPGVVKTLECSTVGTRVVGVIPPRETTISGSGSSLGLGSGDDMVFVADVIGVLPALPTALNSANGSPAAPIAGLPLVTVGKDGVPHAVIPDTPQPAAYTDEILITGKGSVVGHDANIVINYQLTLWRTGQVLPGYDTWASRNPATFNTGEIVAGLRKAIEGRHVGSRVVAVVPPSLAYGPGGNKRLGITGDDDVVFVVDILGLT